MHLRAALRGPFGDPNVLVMPPKSRCKTQSKNMILPLRPVHAPIFTPMLVAVQWAFRCVAPIITDFCSPCAAASLVIVHGRCLSRSNASSGCKASCVDHRKQWRHANVGHCD